MSQMGKGEQELENWKTELIHSFKISQQEARKLKNKRFLEGLEK